MTVYVVLIEDRHADAGVEVFASETAAVEHARAFAKKYALRPEDYQEKRIADWVFYASYSCESDSVRVERKEVQ